jgi:hypothetical protein
MSAERYSLGGSLQDDPRSLRSIAPTEKSPVPSEGSFNSLAPPFLLAGLIPAGPSTALAMPPTLRRRAVS